MSPLLSLAWGWVGSCAVLGAVWLVQLRTRNAGLVDAVWSFSVGGLAAYLAAVAPAPLMLRVLVAAMGALWGLRLGLYLLIRNHGKPEDGRYARLRREWGARANRRMFWFFQLQAVFAALLALAFVAALWRADSPPRWALALAVAVWLVAVVGEAAADAQLAVFKRNPANRGRVCRRGLWRYSRHPNYFFECLHWIAYLPLALGAPLGWLALAPPGIMAVLLLKLSGLPVTEAQAAASRPEYAEYIRTTSALIPWPPRRSSGGANRYR